MLHASGQFREHDEASPNLPGVSAVIQMCIRDRVCEFKRMTAVSDKAPLDYDRDENAPVALLFRA